MEVGGAKGSDVQRQALALPLHTVQGPKEAFVENCPGAPHPQRTGSSIAGVEGARGPGLLSQHRIEYFPTMFQILL
jgi:hypothetical protein